jgi:hypothetical protein
MDETHDALRGLADPPLAGAPPLAEIRARADAQRRARRRNQTIAAIAGVGLVAALGVNVRALQNRPNVLLGPGAASETDDGSGVTELPTETAFPTDPPTASPQDPATEQPTEIPTAVVTSAKGVRLPPADLPTPDTWVGARFEAEADLIEIVASSPSGTSVLDSRQASARDGDTVHYTLYPEDIALRTDTDEVFVGLCCEPVSGAIYPVSLRNPAGLGRSRHQGHHIDINRHLVATAAAYGDVHVTSADLSGRRSLTAGGVDVAVDPQGGRGVALVDTFRVEASSGNRPPKDPHGLRVVFRTTSGAFDDELVSLPQRYCAVAFAARDQVVLLRAAAQTKFRGCVGDHLDVLDLRTHELHTDVVTLAARTSLLSADDAGEHFIYATDAGVYWHTLRGETGQLTEESYTAADW